MISLRIIHLHLRDHLPVNIWVSYILVLLGHIINHHLLTLRGLLLLGLMNFLRSLFILSLSSGFRLRGSAQGE